MKKYLFILLAAMTFVACNDDELIPYVFDYGAQLGEDREFNLEKGMQTITSEEFQNIVVGKAWKCLESHYIMGDGSVQEDDYYSKTEGGGPYHFFFEKENITEILWTDAIEGGGPTELSYPYKYDEESNKVHTYPRLTLLSFDSESAQLIMIVHPSMNLYLLCKYQRMTEDWWAELRESVLN